MGTSRWRPPLGKRRAPRVIAVGAASPGAGKTVVASNLAVAIAGLGPSVVLVDLDFATPRLHELFGVSRASGKPPSSPGKRSTGTLDAALVGTGIRNLLLAPSPVASQRVPPTSEQKRELMRLLHELDGDVVVVDVGSDNRDDLLDYFSAGALRLLVSGPEPVALERTYAFLRAAARRALDRYGARAPQVLDRFRGRLVGNLTAAPEEVETFHAFSRLVREHLTMSLPVLGCLRGSERIPQSMTARRPLLARRGLDENVRTFHAMAELLMMEDAVANDACDLASPEPVILDPITLPANLGRYRRRHPRYPVDWAARLELADGTTEVRVLDVSYSGAAIEVFADLAAGDHGMLHLHQLPGQPALPVVIKNVLAGLHRVGVAFSQPGESSARLEAAAAALSRSANVPT